MRLEWCSPVLEVAIWFLAGSGVYLASDRHIKTIGQAQTQHFHWPRK